MRNLFHWFAFVGYTLTFILLVVIIYWMLFPYKTLVFSDAQFPVQNKVIKQGGTLYYISNYCKYTDLSATLTRNFTDGVVFSTPNETTNRESGCHTITVAVAIPKELPAGNYFLHNRYVYQVNPIREIVIEHDTERFVITE